jgi:phosphopantetheine--protein transferase-like protein
VLFRSLAGRLLLRSVLAQRLKIPPQEIKLALSPQGKPFLPHSDLQISLSHTSGCVAMALCRDHPIGLDVERWDRPVRPALASRFFSPAERKALDAVENDYARDRYFLQLWTAKEAWWKAFDPASGFDMTQLTLHLSPLQLHDQAGRVQGSLHLIEEPEHLLALVALTPDLALTPMIHRWSAKDLQKVLG